MSAAPAPRREPRPVEILLVEDNFGDVLLTQEAFRKAKLANHVTVAEDGEQAMAMLRREGDFCKQPRPDLILLDLNLPRKTGHEVLAEVKADPELRRIPVVVLTTSGAEEDVARAYDSHANVFVTKPVDFDHFTRVIKQIDDFFLTVAQLPRGAA
jgi:CheY-like chemotaxis protein